MTTGLILFNKWMVNPDLNQTYFYIFGMLLGCVDKSALIQVMAWRRVGTKPLPEPMLNHFNQLEINSATCDLTGDFSQ